MRIRSIIFASVILIIGMISSFARGQASSIVNSKHNLSVSGPGPIRSVNEQQVCIFCHTPHNAAPVQPLWNRNLPVTAYTPYRSNSLQAKPGQPTGSSKLCLSCHDGTIALGSVLTTNQPILMAGGMTTLPPGQPANLGTDLSDDHPISFKYDTDLVGKNPKLKNPATLPPQLKLDGDKELQCTTCHDAHDDSNGKFLVIDNSNSQLCNSCHTQGTTDIVSHNQCAACHQPHTAPSGPYLLKGATVTATCNTCHSASAQPLLNIATDLAKVSRHDTNSPVNQLDHIPNNLVCDDCHEAHTMMSASASAAPLISPKLGSIAGVNSAGSAIPRAQFQYEVCFKCHAEQNADQVHMISRQIVQKNTRLQFDPSAVSFHPVEAAGRNLDVPSLVPSLTTSSLIYCTDCHNSDTSTLAGGSGPRGPHGSNVSPVLIAAYDTVDGTTESAAAYALCYRCHERTTLLSNQTFPHSKHIVDQHTPCSICHDSHGIASAQGNSTNNARLINFDNSVVLPLADGTRASYTSTGARAGTCTMLCHGVEHRDLGYAAGNTVQPPGAPAQLMRRRPGQAAPPVITPQLRTLKR